MSTFELTLNVKGDTITARKADGSEETGSVAYDDLTRDTISILENLLINNHLHNRLEFEVLGQHLYKVIFNGAIEAFFEGYLKKAREDRQHLVVKLGFHESDRLANALANLPWEYLYSPSQEFLINYMDLVISRYIQLKEVQPLVGEPGSLRVLVVISSPEGAGLKPVVGDDIIHDLNELSGTLPIELHCMDKPPTLDNFLAELDESRPHVLHFIGYSRLNKDEAASYIALLDSKDEKSVRWVRDKDFVDSCWPHGGDTWKPPLILLYLPYQDPDQDRDAIKIQYDTAHLASRLIHTGIHAVVATRHPITKDAARIFNEVLYRELAKGESIDAAVQRGRQKITRYPGAYDSRVFGTTVLYMHSSGGVITASEPGSQPTALPGGQPARRSFSPPIDSLRAVQRSSTAFSRKNTQADKVEISTSSLTNSILKAGKEKFEEVTAWFSSSEKIKMYEMFIKIGDEIAGKDQLTILGILYIHLKKYQLAGDEARSAVVQAMADACSNEP